jgi:hypothetical protein
MHYIFGGNIFQNVVILALKTLLYADANRIKTSVTKSCNNL